MAHKHNWWWRFRARLGLRVLPECVREDALMGARLVAVERAGAAFAEAVADGDVATEDQVRMALRDMGVQIVEED